MNVLREIAWIKLTCGKLVSLALVALFPQVCFSAAAERLTVAEQDQLTRLKAIGFGTRPRVYIRIFKQEKQLEIWVKNSSKYKLFRNYEICNYSGKLGPKFSEGDRQAPEGFYHVPASAVFWNSAKWPRALNIAFPNVFDAHKKRTGSKLLIHGGCSSKGCFAVRNGPMEEMYALVSLAAKKGQTHFPIHIFPFRFSEKKWQRHKQSAHYTFWQSLQPVFERFNKTRQLPHVLACEEGYQLPVYSSVLNGDNVRYNKCVRPIPIGVVQSLDQSLPKWVMQTAENYPKLARNAVRKEGPGIRVSCNLRRPSCKKWLALRKRMLAKGTLPKHLLK